MSAGGSEPENTAARLDEHLHAFDAVLDRAERALGRGATASAATAAAVAASYAWGNHTGLFASARLEALLTSLSRSLPASSTPRTPRTSRGPGGDAGAAGRGDGPAVLHVATQVYDTGGHTQMLANWVRLDRGRTHHVALTAQGRGPLPAKLVDALGGERAVTRLDDRQSGVLQRAAALRGLARGFDHVVLHVHPGDVVPSVALTALDGPEVLYLDHADHVFWVGRSASHRVVSMRRSGAELCVERRGVDTDRLDLLVRPLRMRPRTVGRAAAKAALGIPPDTVLLVSAAAGSKYEAARGPGFLEVVGPVLDDHPDAALVVAGPAPVGPWAELEARGRGRALGLLPDIRPLLQAADVYVDSYPFSSLTSLLEAATLGVPAVTLATPGAGVLGADTPELDETLVAPTSPDALRRELARLVRDEGARRELGGRTADAVAAFHADGRWVHGVDRVLAPGRRPASRIPPSGDRRGTGVLDQRVAAVMAASLPPGVLEAELRVASLLPAWERPRLAVRRLLQGEGLAPRLLVPEGAARVVAATRRRW